MKIGRLFALALTGFLAGSGASFPSHAADELLLRFSAFVGERNPILRCSMTSLMEELEANPGTRVRLERYFGGTGFGAPAHQYEQAVRGVTDIAFGMLTYSEGQHPLSQLIAMPFLMDDHETATRVLNDVVLPEFLEDELGEARVLNLWLASPYLFHMKQDVGDVTDFNGLRVRTSGEVQIAALTALGAQVASFAAPQTYENLQRGVIDGTLATWTTTTAFNVGEVARFHYELQFGSAVGFTIMNLDTYESLPADVKAIVDRHSGTGAAMKVAACFTQTDARSKEAFSDNTIVTLDPEQRTRMAEMVQPEIDRYLQKLADQGLPAFEVNDRIREALAESDG